MTKTSSNDQPGLIMPAFDVVSEVDLQELRNAVDQSMRELKTRFDFRGVDAGFELAAEVVTVWAQEEFQVNQLVDILKDKMTRRSVDIGALDPRPMEASGKQKRQPFGLKQGIDRDASRKIVKTVKDTKLKVQSQIQGDKVRVTGKKRDDLQAIIAKLKDSDYGVPLQFDNFRD